MHLYRPTGADMWFNVNITKKIRQNSRKLRKSLWKLHTLDIACLYFFSFLHSFVDIYGTVLRGKKVLWIWKWAPSNQIVLLLFPYLILPSHYSIAKRLSSFTLTEINENLLRKNRKNASQDIVHAHFFASTCARAAECLFLMKYVCFCMSCTQTFRSIYSEQQQTKQKRRKNCHAILFVQVNFIFIRFIQHLATAYIYIIVQWTSILWGMSVKLHAKVRCCGNCK